MDNYGWFLAEVPCGRRVDGGEPCGLDTAGAVPCC